MPDHDNGSSGMVDAAQFMRFSEALREDFAALGAAELPPAARERWQRRLIAITTVAKRDLDRAEAQHRRFRADLDRELGRQSVDGAAVEDR